MQISIPLLTAIIAATTAITGVYIGSLLTSNQKLKEQKEEAIEEAYMLLQKTRKMYQDMTVMLIYLAAKKTPDTSQTENSNPSYFSDEDKYRLMYILQFELNANEKIVKAIDKLFTQLMLCVGTSIKDILKNINPSNNLFEDITKQLGDGDHIKAAGILNEDLKNEVTKYISDTEIFLYQAKQDLQMTIFRKRCNFIKGWFTTKIKPLFCFKFM